jgi:hypothetical protein
MHFYYGRRLPGGEHGEELNCSVLEIIQRNIHIERLYDP